MLDEYKRFWTKERIAKAAILNLTPVQVITLASIVHKETGVMPSVSVREGDIVAEIIREIKHTPNCTMLVFGKSYNRKL